MKDGVVQFKCDRCNTWVECRDIVRGEARYCPCALWAVKRDAKGQLWFKCGEGKWKL